MRVKGNRVAVAQLKSQTLEEIQGEQSNIATAEDLDCWRKSTGTAQSWISRRPWLLTRVKGNRVAVAQQKAQTVYRNEIEKYSGDAAWDPDCWRGLSRTEKIWRKKTHSAGEIQYEQKSGGARKPRLCRRESMGIGQRWLIRGPRLLTRVMGNWAAVAQEGCDSSIANHCQSDHGHFLTF